MLKKKIFKIILLGLGKNASKTLELLNKDRNIEVVYCIPRLLTKNKNIWFDSGILYSSAKKLGIKILKQKNVNDLGFSKLIKKNQIDLLINIGHAELFKSHLINSVNFGILNYHPGLLPHARGSGAVVGELINGQNTIGRTCHLVNEKFDLGSIIYQEKFRISKKFNMSDVFDILEKNIDKFILKSVKKVLNKNKKQFHKLKEFGRYYPKFEPGDDYINWNDNSIDIYNKVRSRLQKRFSTTYLKKDLKKILIAEVEIPKKLYKYKSVNGQVIDKSSNGILVKTNDTAIWIKKIFNEKKKIFIVPNFKIGTCFQTINIADFLKCLIAIKKN
jgi:methionyl-tRNA formyltransferase